MEFVKVFTFYLSVCMKEYCALEFSDCRCWVPVNRRSACSYYKPNLSKKQCTTLGCCYAEAISLSSSPMCYRSIENCPPQKCQIIPEQRKTCVSDTVNRKRCFQQKCCFHELGTPHCYSSTDGTSIEEYDTEPFDSMFAYRPHHNYHSIPISYYQHGSLDMVGFCRSGVGINMLPCGGVKTTRNQCLLHMCCWDPKNKLGSGTKCTRTRLHILNYPGIVPKSKWSEWGQWSLCSIQTACGSGTKTRIRTCTGNTYNPYCEGPSSEIALCGNICSFNWSSWSKYGLCVSEEPKCLVGTKTKTRICLNNNGIFQPVSFCAGGSSASTMKKSCKKRLCISFSSWSFVNQCDVSCGGGIRLKSRICLSNTKPNLPYSCFIIGVACNIQQCATDKPFDLLMILDSSVRLDQCDIVEHTLSTIAPFVVGNTLLNKENFPNFFQQSSFVERFLGGLSSVKSGQTHVAVTQHSDTCTVGDSTYLYVYKYLSKYTFGQLPSALSYYCGGISFVSQLFCGVAAMNTENRQNVPDIIFYMIPNIALTNKKLLKIYRDLAKYHSQIIGNAVLYTISAADHSKLTSNQVAANVLFCREWACGNSPATCGRYLGTIYEDPKLVLEKFLLTVS